MESVAELKDYSEKAMLLRADLQHIHNIEIRTREEIARRLMIVEQILLRIAVERSDSFQKVIFKDIGEDRVLFQIPNHPFFYLLVEPPDGWEGGEDAVTIASPPKGTFYTFIQEAIINSDFYEFSNLVPFREVPEVREAKLRDPAFHAAILGITPAS